jgi:hypothetical protein
VAGDLTVTIVGNTRWKYNAEADWCDAFVGEGHRCRILPEVAANGSDIVDAARTSDLLLWISSRHNHPREVMAEAGEHCVTVAWHADLFHGLRRDGRWREYPVWSAQHVLTADGGHDQAWAAMGVTHQWLLPAVRQRWTQTRGRLLPGYGCELAFVGANGATYHDEWPYRRHLLRQLRLLATRRGWRFRNPGGDQRRLERNSKMNDFYRSAGVTVGDSLCLDKTDAKYWSDRVYEACGRGGLLVMPRIDALADHCDGRIPMYEWGDWDDLERVVTRLQDPTIAAETRLRCREWVAGAHTYHHRVNELLGKIGL